MPQRYFIWFAYNGARYHGWQVQPNGNSVQAELEKALATLLRTTVPTTGAGRTDAGVHASCMVAHFDLDRDIDCDQLTYKLNRLLPYDIAVSRIKPVEPDMHARFSAVARTYHYYIHTAKDPFCTFSSCRLHYQLDFDAMNRAAAVLLQTADFASFCKSHADVKTTLCQVSEAEWQQVGTNQWRFVITANRFLRNMVRAVVGTLIDVGRGRISVEEFRQIVAEKKRTSAGESMPGHALYLVDVRYPFDMPAAADALPDAGSPFALSTDTAAPSFVPSPNTPLS